MITRKEVSHKEIEIELTGEDIVKALSEAGYIDMPAKYSCVFIVPGGGDYSNMPVEVDDNSKVVVSFTEIF